MFNTTALDTRTRNLAAPVELPAILGSTHLGGDAVTPPYTVPGWRLIGDDPDNPALVITNHKGAVSANGETVTDWISHKGFVIYARAGGYWLNFGLDSGVKGVVATLAAMLLDSGIDWAALPHDDAATEKEPREHATYLTKDMHAAIEPYKTAIQALDQDKEPKEPEAIYLTLARDNSTTVRELRAALAAAAKAAKEHARKPAATDALVWIKGLDATVRIKDVSDWLAALSVTMQDDAGWAVRNGKSSVKAAGKKWESEARLTLAAPHDEWAPHPENLTVTYKGGVGKATLTARFTNLLNAEYHRDAITAEDCFGATVREGYNGRGLWSVDVIDGDGGERRLSDDELTHYRRLKAAFETAKGIDRLNGRHVARFARRHDTTVGLVLGANGERAMSTYHLGYRMYVPDFELMTSPACWAHATITVG